MVYIDYFELLTGKTVIANLNQAYYFYGCKIRILRI